MFSIEKSMNVIFSPAAQSNQNDLVRMLLLFTNPSLNRGGILRKGGISNNNLHMYGIFFALAAGI